jgi:hypothetical protein
MCYILEILDNATVAALVAVFIAAWIGNKIYKKQKNIDHQFSSEEKLSEALFLLLEHCKAVNQCIDRLACTYILITKEGDKERINKFAAESLPVEINKAGEILMNFLPEDSSKVDSITSLYFNDKPNVLEAQKKVFKEFKEWHDFIQNYALGKTGKPFDLTKRVSAIPELSLNKLDTEIKELLILFKK